MDRLLEVQAPLDWSRVGNETWLSVVDEALELKLFSSLRKAKKGEHAKLIEDFFRDLRQPVWWRGDDCYHPPATEEHVSQLQAAMDCGEFIVTAELTPPVGASLENFVEKAIEIRDLVHAVNITQNPMASPHMSTLASSLSLVQQGIEPILQLTARDYNRLALQSAALGASALGIHNILCLTGDPPVAGRRPVSGLPFDLDATQMMWILRRLRDDGHFLDGSDVNTPPRLFLGSAASPNDPNINHEILRLKKKINAGAQFLQTQLVFSIERLERFLEAMDRGNLMDKVYILVGVAPLRSLKAALYIQDKIPDIFMPKEVIDRMGSSETPEETGLEIALELIQKMKTLPGVSGVHLMNLGWDEFYPRLLREVRLLKIIPQGNVYYNESNQV